MKKKKLILEWDEENEEHSVIGIVSSSKHLEFVHYLNKTEYFNFERVADLEFVIKEDTIYFICFKDNNPEKNNNYKLIKNKGTFGTIGKEFKGLDYILIPGPDNSDSIETIREMLSEQKFIQAVVEINIQKLSDKTKRLLGL